MPCDICCNKYMYDIVKYNCGHTFHKKCLLVNTMSLINPMCIKCKIGKKFTLKKYEDDKDYFEEDDSDEDDSDKDESDDEDTDEKQTRDFPNVTFLHLCLTAVIIVGLYLTRIR